MNVLIKDNNATWVMDIVGEFICTHDGDTHIETITGTHWDTQLEDSIDKEYKVEVCNSCDKQLLSDGTWEL